MPIMENELVHGCGRTFRYPSHYAKHGLGCDGTKAATSGRIAARDGERTPPVRKRSSVLREKKATRKKRDVALAVLLICARHSHWPTRKHTPEDHGPGGRFNPARAT